MRSAIPAPAPPALPVAMRAGRAWLGAAALAVVLGAGVLIAASGVATPRFLGGVHRLPGWGAGPFHGLPLHLTAAQFYIVLGVMAIGYLGVVGCVRQLPAAAIAGVIVVLHVMLLLAPPLLSADVFSYLDYGRLGAIHHLDPYTVTPVAARHDPVFRYTHWRHTRSAYGPLFTFASYALARLPPGDALLAFKAAAAAASLGCVALVSWIAGRIGRPRAAAAAVFGLNPILLVYAVGGAHNDLLMLLGVLAGVALVLAAHEVLGGAAVMAGVAIKASAGLAIPFVVLAARRRWRALAGVMLGTAAVVALAVLAFPSHAVGMIDVLRREQHLVALDSVPNELAHLLGMRHVSPGLRLGLQIVFGVVVVVALVRAWRREHVLTACGWAFVALVATSSWFLAWYTIWPLPFAALSRDRRLLAATLLLQVWYVGNHVPPI